MRPVTFSDLIVAVGGRPIGFDCVNGDVPRIEIDSRKVQPGDLFWALPGTNVDGHQFAADAVTRGAVACVTQADRRTSISVPRILVGDTLRALGDFAAARRRSADAMVIGVTGSNGKTTTRSMLHATLSARFSGIQSPQNFNNHVGVPLSLVSIRPEHEFAVIEMAASHVGEIASLAAIARPEAAVVTTIAPAHLGDFGSIDAIVRAKGELVEAVPAGGFVVLNGDDPRVRALAGRAACRVITAGERSDCDVIARNLRVENDTIEFQVDASRFRVRAIGRHHLTAAVLCVAVGREVGMSDREIAEGLRSFEAVPGRCHRSDIGPWTVIDDTYNANPGSMRAACDVVRGWQGATHKWFVLGDMLSLGPESRQFHHELGEQIAESGAEGLAAIGEFAPDVVSAARARGMDAGCLGVCRDMGTLLMLLECWLEPGDLVLVKGSRGMRMEQVVEGLRTLAESRERKTEVRLAA